MPNQQTPTDPGAAFLLGKIEGQLREIIHGMNNKEAKDEAAARRIAEMFTKIESRLDALEASEHRREGASGLFQVIIRSPALGWLVGAAITAWAILTGRVHV